MFRAAATPPAVHPVALRLGPSPVRRVDAGTRAALSVKSDAFPELRYGGNKVRKLEHILAEASARGATELVTVGAAGSHHVLATAVYGRQVSLRVTALVVPQPATSHARDNLRSTVAAGARVVPVPAEALLPVAVAIHMQRGAMFVPLGGSSVSGSLGYVEAAAELARQVRAGEVEEPQWIVTALGSGGTVAGLAAGLVSSGLASRVVGAAVATPVPALQWMARALARRVARRIGVDADEAAARIDVDGAWVGRGYGYREPPHHRAAEIASIAGLELDATYTEKAFACAIARAESRFVGSVLYWHTLSASPRAPLLVGAPSELEPSLDALLVR